MVIDWVLRVLKTTKDTEHMWQNAWLWLLLAGLLKDSLRKYWLEQIRGMETAKAKAVNKTPREQADMEAVCTHINISSICNNVAMICLLLCGSVVYNYITLHWSYLEWLKYKTAKPLLYMVYRTSNWKQLGRNWSGKEVSFEAV